MWGLPDLVDADHYHQHLLSASAQQLQGPLLGGAFNGIPNLVPGVGPYMPSACAETCEIWPGSNYQAAAQYYGAGVRFNDDSLKAAGLKIGEAIVEQTFGASGIDNGYTFGTPEGYYPDTTSTYRSPGYIRTRAVFDLLYALKPIEFQAAP